jgi:hypothetical protein
MVLAGILGVLFPICSRARSVLMLFSNLAALSTLSTCIRTRVLVIRKDLLLIRLASSCVMDHGFGCIAGVLFSNGSRFSSVLALFSNSQPAPNFEHVFESNFFTRNPVPELPVPTRPFRTVIEEVCSRIVLERFSASNLYPDLSSWLFSFKQRTCRKRSEKKGQSSSQMIAENLPPSKCGAQSRGII